MNKTYYKLSLTILLSIMIGAVAFGADQEVTGKEAEQVRSAIGDYVNRDGGLKGGFFIYDEETGRVLGLEYDHTHETVKKTDTGKYFACVDFVDENKNTYDLDFYLDKTGSGNWEVDEIVVHKVNGENRLTQ